MKKLVCLILFVPFILSGCNAGIVTTTQKENYTISEPKEETYIISGTIIEKYHLYSTDIIIETDDGMKIPVYEGRYSYFSKGLEEGDKVCFEVRKEDGTAYEIIGLGLENIT